MNKKEISSAFENKKAFIAFIAAGDPNIETTERLLPAMAEAGADLIEIGIPFSDPVAEGVVIQRANQRALKAGITTDKIFDMLRRIYPKMEIPLVFLTYINLVYTYGTARFFRNCEECGIKGIIIPDLPYEEKAEIEAECRSHGVSIISLVAPTSEERIEKIAKDSEGFLYLVSSMGVTGMRNEIQTDIGTIAETVRQHTKTPTAVGFGIAKPEQAEEMTRLADGAIVGSAIVNIMEEYGVDCIAPVCRYIAKMKEACRASEEAVG